MKRRANSIAENKVTHFTDNCTIGEGHTPFPPHLFANPPPLHNRHQVGRAKKPVAADRVHLPLCSATASDSHSPDRLAHARHVDELNGGVVPRLLDVRVEDLAAAVELVSQVGGQPGRAGGRRRSRGGRHTQVADVQGARRLGVELVQLRITRAKV